MDDADTREIPQTPFCIPGFHFKIARVTPLFEAAGHIALKIELAADHNFEVNDSSRLKLDQTVWIVGSCHAQESPDRSV